MVYIQKYRPFLFRLDDAAANERRSVQTEGVHKALRLLFQRIVCHFLYGDFAVKFGSVRQEI